MLWVRVSILTFRIGILTHGRRPTWLPAEFSKACAGRSDGSLSISSACRFLRSWSATCGSMASMARSSRAFLLAICFCFCWASLTFVSSSANLRGASAASFSFCFLIAARSSVRCFDSLACACVCDAAGQAIELLQVHLSGLRRVGGGRRGLRFGRVRGRRCIRLQRRFPG